MDPAYRSAVVNQSYMTQGLNQKTLSQGLRPQGAAGQPQPTLANGYRGASKETARTIAGSEQPMPTVPNPPPAQQASHRQRDISPHSGSGNN